ncbi:MAG: DUF6526 family protein [Flavobacteriaceae bacterium]
MQDQNFKNHARMVPGYHYVGFLLMLLLLIGSIVNVIKSSSENIYSASLLVLVAVTLLLISFYARAFSLKAQDRAIKAEENFRHYLLTGKPMNSELKMRQIIGLRFASDGEFPALAEKAVSEKMSEKKIKQSIVTWKPDYYRV